MTELAERVSLADFKPSFELKIVGEPQIEMIPQNEIQYSYVQGFDQDVFALLQWPKRSRQPVEFGNGIICPFKAASMHFNRRKIVISFVHQEQAVLPQKGRIVSQLLLDLFIGRWNNDAANMSQSIRQHAIRSFFQIADPGCGSGLTIYRQLNIETVNHAKQRGEHRWGPARALTEP